MSLILSNVSSEGLFTITLNRSEALNALNKKMINQLTDLLADNFNNKKINCLLLNSNDKKSFCVGADLKERKGMSNDEVIAQLDIQNKLMIALQNFPCPTIAYVNGYALGGGCELALACDLRYSGENAMFALPEVGLGIIPGAGGTQRLTKIVGPSVAKEIIFSGSKLNAQKAFDLKLINNILSIEDLDKKLGEILSKAPLALRCAKQAIDQGLNLDLDSGFKVEKKQYLKLLDTKDRVEALTAFSEKRKANFIGE